jgi:hypothetical protein
MSRSNPNEGNAPNPAVRWFEWNGENGVVRYYDKASDQTIETPQPFTFLLLDQLGTVTGWDNESDCGITANQVKDSRQETLVVRSRKGGTIAEGLYKDIKDRVNAAGGKFTANCYIGFKQDGALVIGVLQFKGAALHSWADFIKDNRKAAYEKAIVIAGYNEGKKGKVVFRVPVLQLKDTSDETNRQAHALDVVFQQWLDGYLKRNTKDRVDEHDQQDGDGSDEPPPPNDPDYGHSIDDSDVPF